MPSFVHQFHALSCPQWAVCLAQRVSECEGCKGSRPFCCIVRFARAKVHADGTELGGAAGLKKYSIEGHGCLHDGLTIASRFLQDFLKIFCGVLQPAVVHGSATTLPFAFLVRALTPNG
jgi:hypothetical protein